MKRRTRAGEMPHALDRVSQTLACAPPTFTSRHACTSLHSTGQSLRPVVPRGRTIASVMPHRLHIHNARSQGRPTRLSAASLPQH